MSKHCFLRRHPGEGTPMILAIVLVLLMLFCTVAEFSRVWIIAQGVKEAAQQAVISTINDNYDDVYHAVRELSLIHILQLASCDLKSVGYLSSQLPLLGELKWDKDVYKRQLTSYGLLHREDYQPMQTQVQERFEMDMQ